MLDFTFYRPFQWSLVVDLCFCLFIFPFLNYWRLQWVQQRRKPKEWSCALCQTSEQGFNQNLEGKEQKSMTSIETWGLTCQHWHKGEDRHWMGKKKPNFPWKVKWRVLINLPFHPGTSLSLSLSLSLFLCIKQVSDITILQS